MMTIGISFRMSPLEYFVSRRSKIRLVTQETSLILPKFSKSVNRAKPAHLIVVLLLALTWGSSFILMKRGLKDGEGTPVFTPSQVAALRMTFAALVLLPVSLRAFRKIRKEDWKSLIVVGLAGSGIPAFLFANSQVFLDSGLAGLLNTLTPLFTLLIGFFIFQRQVIANQVFGIVVGLIGAVILISLKGFGPSSHWEYTLLIVVATVLYGLSVNTITAKLKHIKAIEITALSMLIVGLPCAGYVFFSDVAGVLENHPSGWSSLGYVALLGVVGSAAANIFFFKLTQETGAIFASSVTYLIPIAAVLWGVYDGEKLTFMHAVCGAIILVGVWLVNKKPDVKPVSQ
jgi:drug/metabolite transporter (DMT)-like permease